MSVSLAGGLLPLGNRAGSGGAGSKSNLTGGLIPLTSARPTASFRNEPGDGGDGISGGWDQEEEESERGKEPTLGGTRSDKKGKKSSSSRRRGGKEKSGGGHEPSPSSRRRRGSKGSRDILDDSPITAGLGGGSSGNMEGWDRSSPGGDVNANMEAEDEDDSYLFMGATAGAKGKKSAGGEAGQGSLDYDSTDSFGLPKAKPKARKQDVDLKPAHVVSETSKALAGAGSVSTHEGISSSRPVTSATTDWLSRDSTTSSTSFRGRPSPTPDAEGAPETAAAAATPEPQADLDDDFDFPDDDLNDLLEMTDPAVLTKGSLNATASASATMPPLLPLGESTDLPRDDRKKPRERPSAATASSSSGATYEGNTHLGESEGEAARRRSPSPPSSPREDHRNRHSLRSRRGRGITYSGNQDNLESGGGMSEQSEESVRRGRRGFESPSQDEVEPTAINAVAGGVSQTAASAAGPLMRSSTARAGSRGDRDEVLPGEGATGNGARDDRALEPSPRAHGLGREASASAVSGETTLGEAASSLESKGGDGHGNARGPLTSSGPGIAPKVGTRAPRRSALAGADKSKTKSRQPKSRGVTFDDDLVGVDALDILPGSSSDEAEIRADGGDAPPAKTDEIPSTVSTSGQHGHHQDFARPASTLAAGKTPGVAARPSADPNPGGAGGGGETASALQRRAAGPSSAGKASRRSSSPATMTEGLSPAAARLMAEDSSSEESNVPKASEASAMESLLGLEEPRPGSSSAGERSQGRPGATGLFGQGLKDAGEGEGMATTDEAKLDLALGFTPSSMDGSRKPRRTLPAGASRRRRPRGGVSLTTADAESKQANFLSLASTSSEPATVSLGDTAGGNAAAGGAGATAAGVGDAAKDAGEAGNGPSRRASGVPSAPAGPVARASRVEKTPSADSAVVDTGTLKSEPSASPSALPAGALLSALPATSNSSTPGADTISRGGSPSSLTIGPRHGSTTTSTTIANSSEVENAGESRSVDASVLASLERQLVLLAGEKEAIAARSSRDEQRMQKDGELAREATAKAQARALDSEAALAVARARISQLEAEAAEHSSQLATVESRAASGLRAEQEACLKKISDGETRHQEGLRQADSRHREELAEVKRLHKEELQDTRQRNSDSKTLQALAGQVQASAGAVKLLQSEMMERKNVSEVSREGQMEARERLIKELEQSARRAQQTAEDEVQRLQGTLMAMDQVMSALRGQNAGERERLRQEHLRMEALQGSMVAEVSAVRKSVDEERQRLSERCAALDREKRQAEAEARAESERLADQRLKLEADRESFAALQVSASKAADEMARRHAGEAERLNLARQSLEREASAFEARLDSARADLQKADRVRDSLDRMREQDELERRRLKALSGDLERAFEDVRTRSEDSEERRREAEAIKTEALAASKAASKEREAAQLQSVRVEEVARRLEAERTSIAQARAQSATELSTSRRLKAELARAFAAQQRQHARGVGTAADVVLSSRSSPLDRQHAGGSGGGDTGAGGAIGVGGRGSGGGAVVGAMRAIPGLPPDAISAPTAAAAAAAAAAGSGGGSGSTFPSPPDNDAGGVGVGVGVGVGIPFTGVAAAEATLQAISSAPAFPGMDVGRELGRLARRAADLRECTKAQSAFLSSSRAARFSSAAQTAPEESNTNITTMAGIGLDKPDFRARSPPELIDSASDAAGRGDGVEVGVARQEGVRDWTQGFDLGAWGISLSSTVMEELDRIERACSQRGSALKEEEPFVDTLGRDESPVAV